MTPERRAELLKHMLQPDGSLANLGVYIGWEVGDERATLDGHFTADDLEAIALHMRETKKP